jgi:hypothetical protein
MGAAEKTGNVFLTLLEKIKEKSIQEGRWNQDEKQDTLKQEKKKRAPKPKPDPRRHQNFPKIYPDIFRTPGLYLVFDHLWKHSKKTKTGKLRWSGYIKDVAFELNRSYAQTRRDFKTLEEKKILHRWNTGKRFPENIKAGTDPKYHQTVLTLCWNPADFKRQRILEKKAARNRARKDQKCLSS